MRIDPHDIDQLGHELDALVLELVERFRVAHQAGRVNATTGEVKSKAFRDELATVIGEVWTQWLRGCVRQAMAQDTAPPKVTCASPRPQTPAPAEEEPIPF